MACFGGLVPALNPLAPHLEAATLFCVLTSYESIKVLGFGVFVVLLKSIDGFWWCLGRFVVVWFLVFLGSFDLLA